MMPSQAEIRLECAFTNMNAVSGENLTHLCLLMKSVSGHHAPHRRRSPQCHGRSAVLPDDGDMHLGRERPPQAEAWDHDRGVAEGVAHAPDASFTAANGRTDCYTGGTERRPLWYSQAVQSKTH